MAVNRFMKPAEQPLLDTYVPLPFKEMSMAYAAKQKEHNDAEELAGSLDDEVLKVRASTPLHKNVLGQIRTDLDTEISDLVDKNNRPIKAVFSKKGSAINGNYPYPLYSLETKITWWDRYGESNIPSRELNFKVYQVEFK